MCRKWNWDAKNNLGAYVPKSRNDMVQKVLYSKESPEEALANAAKQLDEEIAAAAK